MTTTTASPGLGDLEAAQQLAPDLLARERWSREQMVTFQEQRFRVLLDHAVSASPYYRERFGLNAAQGEVRLEALPTLPKATLMAEFDRIATDPRLRLHALDAHVASDDNAELFLDEFRVFSTSGTSGRRGLFVYGEREFAAWNACLLRTMWRIGIQPGMRVAPIGAPKLLHITGRQFAALRAGRSDAPRLSVLTPLPEIVETLNAYQPEALVGYPSMMGLLAQEQLRGTLRIEPRIVALGGEVLTDETRAAIDAAWRIDPCQVYASTEVPIIASGAPGEEGLYQCDDLVIVEVVDEQNRPVPAGQPGFKVLLTNLVNYAQPLIRYELSDSVVQAPSPRPGELPYQRILRIDGRSDDILHVAGRDGKDVMLHPYRLRAPFATLTDVRQYQIVYDGRELRVAVVLEPVAARDVLAQVHAALATTLEEAGALPLPIEVVPTAKIAREPGHAAKLKLIKAV